jgi:hypothetical protein
MKLQSLYKAFVQKGISADVRSAADIKRRLQDEKKKFDGMDDDEKARFDEDRLWNPYSDTRVLHGDDSVDVKSMIVGIDMEVGEILLADRLREKGTKIDLVLAHHPEGRGISNLYDVMGLQADIMNKHGIPINVAEGILQPAVDKISRRLLPLNHMRAVDAARLLDIPMMCCHTPADNCVNDYLQKKFNRAKPRKISNVLDVLRKIPEYQDAEKTGACLKVVAGSKDGRAGKIYVNMTGGTEGAKELYEKLAGTEAGTLVEMHMSEEHLEEAKKHHINVIIAGHIASDTLGMNLLLDSVEKKSKLNIVECSGFRRHKH